MMTIKWKTLGVIIGLFATLFLGVGKAPLAASPFDFGWSSPIVVEKKSKGRLTTYLAWPIQLRNNTVRLLSPQLEIVAVTDTGRQYNPDPAIHVHRPPHRYPLVAMTDMGDGIFPSVTQNTVAVFQQIDPKASRIDFYVGGLVDLDLVGEKRYLKITYKRILSGWEWEGTSFFK